MKTDTLGATILDAHVLTGQTYFQWNGFKTMHVPYSEKRRNIMQLLFCLCPKCKYRSRDRAVFSEVSYVVTMISYRSPTVC